MDTVPFAFCDAVISTLRCLPEHAHLGGMWNSSLQEHRENRKMCSLRIGYVHGKWSYRLCVGESINEINFDELRRESKKYVRFHRIWLSDNEHTHDADEEQIMELIEVSKHCMHEAILCFGYIDNRGHVGELMKCLALLCNITFREVELYTMIPQHCEFLKAQLQSQRLRQVMLWPEDGWPEGMLTVIEDHMKYKDVEVLHSVHTYTL